MRWSYIKRGNFGFQFVKSIAAKMLSGCVKVLLPRSTNKAGCNKVELTTQTII